MKLWSFINFVPARTSDRFGRSRFANSTPTYFGGRFVQFLYARSIALAACLAFLAACAGGAGTATMPGSPANRASGSKAGTIDHIVIIVQENRSVDNLFATFPGVNGATSGYYLKKVGNKRVPTLVQLVKKPLAGGIDFNHNSVAYNYACDGKDTYPKTSCDMDGFNLEGPGGPSNAPYQYIDPKDIKQYWDFAKHYALGDHLFQTQGSGSFTAHQDLIAGGTMIANANCGSSEPTCAVIDYPSNFKDWGCGADHREPRRRCSPRRANIFRPSDRFRA